MKHWNWSALMFVATGTALLAGCGASDGAGTEGEETTGTTASALGASNDHTVLILSTSVVPDTAPGGDPTKSPEQEAAEALGYTVEVASPGTWASKSTGDFASYRAIILGDPDCSTTPEVNIAAAQANIGAWGAAVTGNVTIFGADPVFHTLHSGTPVSTNARLATSTAIKFAATGTKTGAYISLSCYYTNAALNTPVPILAPFASGGTSFSVEGNLGCSDPVHNPLVAPAVFNVLTDSVLSNWQCSAHEGFDSLPSNFATVAIDAARTEGPGIRTFPDGSTGLSYFIARQAATVTPACVQGTQQLHLEDRDVVNAGVATTTFRLGADATLNGNGAVAGNADLRNRATVNGTLSVAGTVSRQPGVTITNLVNPASVTLAPLPTKTFTVGTGTRNINSSTALSPGNYGNVFVNGGTLTLSPGTYNFASLTLNASVRVVFSGSNATAINVQGALTVNSAVAFTAPSASLVSWYSNTSITVRAGQTTAFPGSVLAPNGNVLIDPRNTVNGCVQGQTVDIEPDVRVNGR